MGSKKLWLELGASGSARQGREEETHSEFRIVFAAARALLQNVAPLGRDAPQGPLGEPASEPPAPWLACRTGPSGQWYAVAPRGGQIHPRPPHVGVEQPASARSFLGALTANRARQ